MHEKKNDFVEISKNLETDTDLKIILLNYQNTYLGKSNMMRAKLQEMLTV